MTTATTANLGRMAPAKRRATVEALLGSDELNRSTGWHAVSRARVTYELVRGAGDRTITVDVLGVAVDATGRADALIVRTDGALYTIPLPVLIRIEAPL